MPGPGAWVRGGLGARGHTRRLLTPRLSKARAVKESQSLASPAPSVMPSPRTSEDPSASPAASAELCFPGLQPYPPV